MVTMQPAGVADRRDDGRSARRAPDLVALGKDGRGQDRFTSRDMLETKRGWNAPP